MQLLTQVWPALIAVCVGASAAFCANLVTLVMIDKINERMPESERMSHFGGGGWNVRGRFKRLYPESRLVLLRDSCAVILVLCFIVIVRYWVFS